MSLRTIEELEVRVVYLLARSFRNITPLKWDSFDGKVAKLTVDARSDNDQLVVVGYRGSALVRLDGRPYFSLDGYHRFIPLTRGRHSVEAEFTPYAAFGELVGIDPGKPYLVTRSYPAWRLWAYGRAILDLARRVNDAEVRDSLLGALSEALREVPFTSISRDQALLTAEIYGMPWRERITQTITPDLDNVFTEDSTEDFAFERALNILRGRLNELVSRFGKRGLLVGFAHAHIDTAWLWNFDETRRKVLRTFSTVVTLMRRYDFAYMQSSALYYQWLLEDDPQLFNEVKRLVEEGRWILGAGWVESDTNMLTGESWARQMLYSQRFYLRHFGRLAEILWLPDTFGFTASLPQIARLGGVKAFATHKVFWNDTNKFPYNVFYWVAPDGSKIPAIAFGNGRGGYNGDFTVQGVWEQWSNWVDKNHPVLYSYGYGDGGGGPSEEMFLTADAVNDLPILPKVSLTTGVKYLDLLRPVNEWRGELYLETHRGTLTSHSRMKLLHRRAEIALREGELWSALAGIYDGARFSELWKTLLKDQFHDVLPGSAIREVYQQVVYPELEKIINESYSVAESAARKIAGEGEALLVFNSLPWDRVDYVVVKEPIEGGQRIDEGYLVRVRAPSVGYTQLKAIQPEVPATVSETNDGYVLENKYLRVKVDRLGRLVSVFDKEAGREVLREPSNVIVAYENMPGWADAWDIEKGYKVTSFNITASESSIVAKGPLMAGVRFTYRFRRSTIIQEVRLYADCRRIDFKTTLRLVDRELLYKAWFHLDLNADKATSDIPFGVVERPTVKNTSWDLARFEVPIQKWVDLSEHDYGVALLNDGKYAASLEGSSIGLTLAKTPIFPDPTTDLDEVTFTYSLYPHRGDWKGGQVYRRALELNIPMIVTRGRPGEASLVRLEPENLVLEAVKASEDDPKALVFRIYEIYNARGVGRLTLPFKPSEAYTTDLLELNRIDRKIAIRDNTVEFEYRNREIITLIVKP